MRKFFGLLIAALFWGITGCDGEPQLPVAVEKTTVEVKNIPGQQPDGAIEAFIPDIKKILPEFDRFGMQLGREVELLDRSGKSVGMLRIVPDKYERVEGFNGYIDAAIVLKNDKIAGIAIGENQETPRWMQKVRKAGFLKKWDGKSLNDAATMQVDAVTGATYSSEAIAGEVKAAAL